MSTNSQITYLLTQIHEKKTLYDSKKPFPKIMEKSFYHASRIELTYHSNAIEGNTLTLADTALVIDEQLSIPGKKLREIYEARNHDQALDFVEKIAAENRDLTEADILKIHEIILRDIDDEYAGRYRDLPVRITGSTIILPNPLKVPTLMKNLVESLVYPDQDILIFSGFKKYEFLAIHPFIDGNGRTSRLIWNYFLLKNGYPLAYIDIADRPRYMNALQQMDTGDHDQYILLILESIERSLDRFLISF